MTTNRSMPSMHQRGMTVLEVVVALVVAVTFLPIMLSSANQAYMQLKLAELRVRALELAASKVEEISQGDQGGAFPKEGLENGLKWRVEAMRADPSNGSSMEGSHLLKIYTISVAQEKHDPLIVLSVQRVSTQR